MSAPGSDCLRLASTKEAPRIARLRVEAACDGLGEAETAVAVLLTSELVTNAVLHPKRRGPGMEDDGIVVRVERTTQGVAVEVHDHDPRPLPKPPSAASAELDAHGRGLFLVRELASMWGVSFPGRGGKVVWFEVSSPRHLPREVTTARSRALVRLRGLVWPCVGRVWVRWQRVRLAGVIASHRRRTSARHGGE